MHLLIGTSTVTYIGQSVFDLHIDVVGLRNATH